MLRVAVVGAGGTAWNVRRGYARMAGVEWTLAVDTNPEILKECAAEGAKRGSARFEDALAGDIDVVDVSTPNHLHEEHAVRALEAGKHVLLQKPMAQNLAAADRILAASRKAKGTLGMYMVLFTSPVVWEIRKMIELGVLGKIQGVRARDAHYGGLSMPGGEGNWRGSAELTGGGSFIQLSVHSLNLIQWWIGARAREAMAFSGNQYCPNIGGDDVTAACLRFGTDEKAVVGVFESGYASEGRAREVYGTKGFARYMNQDSVEVLLDAPYSGGVIQYKEPGKVVRFAAPYPAEDDMTNPVNQNRMFLEAVGAGKRPFMDGEAGRHDLAVCAAVYESARTGRRVGVDELVR